MPSGPSLIRRTLKTSRSLHRSRAITRRPNMSERFSGRTVLITGAIGELGKAMAHAFADEGAKVIVTGRKEKQGRAFAATSGKGAIFLRLDVTDESSWQAAIGK